MIEIRLEETALRNWPRHLLHLLTMTSHEC